jgi:hypothetical protein
MFYTHSDFEDVACFVIIKDYAESGELIRNHR